MIVLVDRNSPQGVTYMNLMTKPGLGLGLYNLSDNPLLYH
jgi:hypothetical protein